jgi:hypothetical protein
MRCTKVTIEEIKFRVALAQEQWEGLHETTEQLKTYIQGAKEYLDKAREELARFDGEIPSSVTLTQSGPEVPKLINLNSQITIQSSKS